MEIVEPGTHDLATQWLARLWEIQARPINDSQVAQLLAKSSENSTT